jgi:alpha-glucosidase
MTDLRLTYRRLLARVRLVTRTVTELGLPTLGLVAANSARRQVVMWRDALDRGAVIGQTPGRVREVATGASGARIAFEHADLEVAFLAPDVIRLSWGPGALPVPYALVGDTPWTAPTVTTSRLADGGLLLRSSDAVITVDGEGSVRISRPDGKLIRTEAPPVRRGSAWELRHSMRPGERFSGLGEQAAGVDLRGGRFQLWNTDVGGSWTTSQDPLYLGIPVVVGTHPDGDALVFYENSTRGTFRFGEASGSVSEVGAVAARREPGMASVGFAGGVLRHYVMVGEVPHVMDRYSELTGRPALPPRWALGYHQSRWGYKTDADVRAVVDGYRSLGVPLSAVHLDIDYMDGYRVFTFDRARFPDPAALAREVATSGARLVTIVDPGVKVDPEYAVYRLGVEGRYFCVDGHDRPVEGVVWPGRVVFPDFTDADARTWWGDRYRVLTDAGIAGIWHDMNEPTSISLLGDPSLPLSTRHEFDGRGGDHGEGHNVYGLLMNRAGFEGLVRARPDRRPFIVSRSGWAGMQRWAWNWTGDVASTWPAMRQQIATVVGLGLSGVPYSGPDIGGFSGVPDDELYVRWLQMSVMLPYCRTHSVLGAPAREPWRFEEPCRTTIISWLRFRYRLLPYLYTLAHQATASGAPLVRPLWWPSPDRGADATDRPDGIGVDSASPTGGCDDAFFLGDALLVAPVTASGATERTLTLPAGRWRSLWASDTDGGDGGLEVRLDVSADRIPLLVRAGSIVPLDDAWMDDGLRLPLDADLPVEGRSRRLALDHGPQQLAFHCWPTEAGEAWGRCVDDGGDGDGPMRRDRLRLTGALPGGSAVLTWERDGQFPPPASVRVVVHGFAPGHAVADGRPLALSGSSVVCGVFTQLRLAELRPVGA